MKSRPTLLVLAVFSSALACTLPAYGQSSRAAASFSAASQSERNAVELKQGMSLAEVQRLLGKPRRTSLNNGGSTATSSQANLRWTYMWPRASSSDNVLNVDFVSKAPAEWSVNSWDWSNY